MGFVTSATMNFHKYGRRRFRSSVNVFSPYVAIVVLFAAYSWNGNGFGICPFLLGSTDMFAPVSTKKDSFEFLSVMNRRWDFS